MNRLFACCVLAGAAFVAYPHSILSASPAPAEGVDILVGGVPQPRYAHDGRLYVEAIKGGSTRFDCIILTAFVSRSRCQWTASTPSMPARLPLLTRANGCSSPYQTVTISGWQTSQTRGAPLRVHDRGALVRPGTRQDRQPGRDCRGILQERAPAIVTEASERSVRAPGEPRHRRSVSRATGLACGPRQSKRADKEYAATGMGRRTGHAVERYGSISKRPRSVHEHPLRVPSAARQARHPAPRSGVDPLQRRERARGFEGGFAPEVPRSR